MDKSTVVKQPKTRGPTLTGTLVKRGHILKTWRRRYFELVGHQLSYYSRKGGARKGFFTLIGETECEDANIRPNCFFLRNETGVSSGYTLFLSADDPAVKDTWMEAILSVIQQQRRKLSPHMTSSNPSTSLVGKHVRTITSMDSQIQLSSESEDEIYVRVSQARWLFPKDIGGTSDPYAVVTVCGQSQRTPTIMKDLNPQWGVVFCFKLASRARYVRIEVWDEDPYKSDFLGQVFIPVLSLARNRRVCSWYQLGKRSPKSHVSGEIELELFKNCAIPPSCQKLFRRVQSLPEFKLACDDLVDQWDSIKKSVIGDVVLDAAAKLEDETSEDVDILGLMAFSEAEYSARHSTSENTISKFDPVDVFFTKHSHSIRFPTSMPPTEFEKVEDFALNATLKSHTDRGGVYSHGIVIVTNYRLIFVADTYLSNDSIKGCEELTTQIPVNMISSISLGTEQDAFGIVGKSLPMLRVHCRDARILTFLYRGGAKRVDSSSMPNKQSEKKVGISQIIQSAFGAKSSVTANKSVGTRRDSTDSTKPLSPLDGRRRNSSVSEIMHETSGLISQLIGGRARSASPNQHFDADQQLQSTVMFDNEWVGNEADEIEATYSSEGDPFSRIYCRLYWRVVNRHFENESTMSQFASYCMLLKKSCSATGGSALRRAQAAFIDIVREQINLSWNVYDPVAEFQRLKIPDGRWRLSTSNSAYGLCSTYPSVLAFPKCVSDAILERVAEFRSKGRLPTLCWRHPKTLATICRSSQPLAGLQNQKSSDDETLLNAINDASGTAVRECFDGPYEEEYSVSVLARGYVRPYVIVDARPKLNAQANQAAGKGFESANNYPNCRLLFMGIANIHVMRRSQEDLDGACLATGSEDAEWLKNIDASGWCGHVHLVLHAAMRIVHFIANRGYSVLIHCSDGWDRTSQLSSLAMLMMDDYYRTIRGFEVLVEKEWISFGHKFEDRLGFSGSSDERSPVFIQFLDCVHQLVLQLPNAFEFNEGFLLFIMQQCQSGWFGNFLCNSEKDLHDSGAPDKCLSVWLYVNCNMAKFRNTSFVPNPASNEGDNIVILPVVSSKRMNVWHNWFLSWHDRVYRMAWEQNNEGFLQEDMPVVTWAHDVSADACYLCERPFTFYRRRHHCRNCGLIFCEACCNQTRVLCLSGSENLTSDPVRVCQTCTAIVDASSKKQKSALGRLQGMQSTDESTTTLSYFPRALAGRTKAENQSVDDSLLGKQPTKRFMNRMPFHKQSNDDSDISGPKGNNEPALYESEEENEVAMIGRMKERESDDWKGDDEPLIAKNPYVETIASDVAEKDEDEVQARQSINLNNARKSFRSSMRLQDLAPSLPPRKSKQAPPLPPRKNPTPPSSPTSADKPTSETTASQAVAAVPDVTPVDHRPTSFFNNTRYAI